MEQKNLLTMQAFEDAYEKVSRITLSTELVYKVNRTKGGLDISKNTRLW